MAKLHADYLNDDSSAVKAHEDAITFLIEGSALTDGDDDDIDIADEGVGDGNEDGDAQRIQTHTRTPQKESNHGISKDSPTSVLDMNMNKNMNSESSNQCRSKKCNNNSNSKHKYNIVKLTTHERARLISMSLTSLARIYFQVECVRQRIRERQATSPDDDDDDHNDDDDDALLEEDALRYYQEALNFLKSVEDPTSSTYIAAFSNDTHMNSSVNGSVNANGNVNAEDESHSQLSHSQSHSHSHIRSHSGSAASVSVVSVSEASLGSYIYGQVQVYPLDLRHDIANILVEMAILHKRRVKINTKSKSNPQTPSHSHSHSHSIIIALLEEARAIKIQLQTDLQDQEMMESLLGSAYEKNGNYKNAHACYQRVLTIRKILFGMESIQVANLYASMSNLNRKAKEYSMSLSWNKKAIALYQLCEARVQSQQQQQQQSSSQSQVSALRDPDDDHDHHDTDVDDSSEAEHMKFEVKRNLIGTLQNQGMLYVEVDELDKAIATYLIIIEKQVDFHGEEHPDVAKTLNVLGDLYMIKDDLSEAKASFNRALKLYRKYGMGDADPDMVSTLQRLDEIESLVNDSRGVGANGVADSDVDARLRKHRENSFAAKGRIQKMEDQRQQQRSRQRQRQKEPKRKESLPDFNEEFFPENEYCNVIETDPHFVDNDDAVSQITFMTHKEMAKKDAARKQRNDWMEASIENWSPAAEYVFKAVDKIATGFNQGLNQVTEQVTKQFLQLEQQNATKGCDRRAIPADVSKGCETRNIFPVIEEEVDGQEWEYSTKLTEPTCSGSNLDSPVQQGKKERQSHSLDTEIKLESTKSQSFSHLASCDATKSFDHDVATRIDSQNIITIDHERERSKRVIVGDESVANDTFASSALHGMKINTDESVGAWTNTSSTLFGVNINTDASLVSTATGNIRTRRDGGGALSQKNREIPQNRREIQGATCNRGQKSRDGCDMDDLLAQMNVVTCDMEGDTAKPFQELLKGEGKDGNQPQNSDIINDDTFEKISACLDSLIELKDRYGPGHVKIINTMLTLANLYIEHGDDSKGIKKYHEALELCQKKYGRNSLQVSNIYVKLGKYYLKDGDIDRAIDNYGLAKDIEVYLYGGSHPRIAKLLNYMGLAELERGDFDGDVAMDYLHEALSIQKLHLGPNEINPDVSETLVNMGAIYYKERNSFKKIRAKKDSYQNFIESGMLGKIAFAHSERGEYIMAMNFYDEVLELLKNKDDGRCTNRIVATLKSLGSLNVKAGRFTVANDHYRQALDLIESCDDASPLDIANAKGDIGVVKYHNGEFKEAAKLLENAVSVQRAHLSNEHPRVAKTLYHLGVIKRTTCDFERASYTLKQAQRIQMSLLQEDHPDTIYTQMEIGKLLLDSDKVDDAIAQFESIFKNQRHLFGSEHPDLAQTLYYIGICLARKGDVSKAMKYSERCFRMQQKVLKFDCPAIASTLDQIGLLFLSSGKVQKATKAFDHSLQIRREVGEDHYEIAYSLLNLGQLNTSTRSYNAALFYYKDAMRIAVRSFGLEHPLIGDIHVGVGNLNTRKCHFDEAKKELLLALDIYKKALFPETHFKVRKAKEDLKRVEHEEALCV